MLTTTGAQFLKDTHGIETSAVDSRLAPPWVLIGQPDDEYPDWQCRECKAKVSVGRYPTHQSHEPTCAYSAQPIIERAEKAERALTASEQRVKRYAILRQNVTPVELARRLGVTWVDIPKDQSIEEKIDELCDAGLAAGKLLP